MILLETEVVKRLHYNYLQIQSNNQIMWMILIITSKLSDHHLLISNNNNKLLDKINAKRRIKTKRKGKVKLHYQIVINSIKLHIKNK